MSAQALHWMQDMLAQDGECQRVEARLRGLFADRRHGQSIRDDLRAGLPALPIWGCRSSCARCSSPPTRTSCRDDYRCPQATHDRDTAPPARPVSRDRQSARRSDRQCGKELLGLLGLERTLPIGTQGVHCGRLEALVIVGDPDEVLALSSAQLPSPPDLTCPQEGVATRRRLFVRSVLDRFPVRIHTAPPLPVRDSALGRAAHPLTEPGMAPRRPLF